MQIYIPYVKITLKKFKNIRHFQIKMATTQKGKYALRCRRSEEEYEVIADEFDSDIDEEYPEKDDELLDLVENDLEDAIMGNESMYVDEDLVDTVVDDNVTANTPVTNAQKGVPNDWDGTKWKDGNIETPWIPQFANEGRFLINIPDDADELYFFTLFVTDEVLQSIVTETNRYAAEFLEKNHEKLKPKSRFRLWKKDLSVDKLKKFIALTFYFGVVQKRNVKSYWSTDSIYSTPFPSNIMSRDEFFNIFSFLHLNDNSTYINKGQDGYNPCKKLGFFYEFVTSRFSEVWLPRQNLSIDEGCVPFKGRIHFRCYNPKKIDKYHIKTYKLVDSSINYCLEFSLYTGVHNFPLSEFGVTYDLVLYMCRKYMNQGYIIFMDNYYTSPFLFWELKKRETGGVGTVRLSRKGLPDGIVKTKLKTAGEEKTMSYDNDILALKIFDCKIVTLLSTVYNADLIDTGKTHHQTKEPIKKPKIIVQYNKFMGGVDANDQLLKYNHFSKRTIKWWKKVFFRLINVCMVNAFTLMKTFKSLNGQRYKLSQTEFRLIVIRQLVNSANHVVPENVPQSNEFERLIGRHFIHKIQVPANVKSIVVKRTCKVCSPAERENDRRLNNAKRKRTGCETIYECEQCKVSLCIEPCFKIYHTQKDFITYYITNFIRN